MQKQQTFTLTFGEVAENHVGMQKLGRALLPGEGFTVEDIESLAQSLHTDHGITTEIHRLDTDSIRELFPDIEPVSVLVIRDGVNLLLRGTGYTKDDLFVEQDRLPKDTKAFMYGRVVNKHARYNLCFDQRAQEPDYENKKGRVVAMDEVPLLKLLQRKIEEAVGPKAHEMKIEGNYYYDIAKCGIGFHGDGERIRVIGVRLGAPLPMHYQWFYRNEAMGDRIQVPLNGGDIYIMSEKAVGNDWKQRSIPTLRHATGCAKFTTIKE